MPRDLSLDLARGFTVLCIPAIHSVMLYSHPSVYASWLGIPLTFIAEGPGGQLFMVLMGMGIAFKENQTWKAVLFKAFLLVLTGYALNFLKFDVLLLLRVMPASVISTLQLPQGIGGLLQAFLLGDILHFASMALVLTFAVRRFRDYWFWSVILAIVIIIISPLLWDITNNYLLQLLGGQPTRVFFPLFPWLVYPLLGLTIGFFWNRDALQTAIYCGWWGLALLIIGLLGSWLFKQHSEVGFYRTLPFETIWHLGIVLLALYGWKRAELFILPLSPIGQLLTFCSKHITSIYFIQWILICWLLPFIGYQILNTFQSFIIAVYMTGTVLTISVFVHAKPPYAKKDL